MIKDNGYFKNNSRTSLPFPAKGNWQEKSMYVLKIIKSGSAADVAGKMAAMEEIENVATLEEKVETALSELLEQGKVEGSVEEQVMIYNQLNN